MGIPAVAFFFFRVVVVSRGACFLSAFLSHHLCLSIHLFGFRMLRSIAVISRQKGRRSNVIKRFMCVPNNEQQYLHIAPSGDFWCGTKIFAAKHLSSNYLKSFPLPVGFNEERLEELPFKVFVEMYDAGELSDTLKAK